MLRNCIFYLLLQIKTRYEVEKKKKRVGQRPSIKIVQYDLTVVETVVESYEGRGVD